MFQSFSAMLKPIFPIRNSMSHRVLFTVNMHSYFQSILMTLNTVSVYPRTDITSTVSYRFHFHHFRQWLPKVLEHIAEFQHFSVLCFPLPPYNVNLFGNMGSVTYGRSLVENCFSEPFEI